jgi:hypothetical protein
MKKYFFLAAGIAAAGVIYYMNREDVDVKVRKTAKKLRRELEPMEEKVSDRLENFADTIININKKLRIATRILDAALGKIAA